MINQLENTNAIGSTANTEQWMDIKGFEERYQISSSGRIKSLPRRFDTHNNGYVLVKEKIISPGLGHNGYFLTSLRVIPNGRRINFRIHRLVAEAFIPNPENKPQVNHINGIKSDDRACNLEWVSIKENIHHARDVLGAYRGERNNKARLHVEDVIEIRILLMSGMSLADIAKLKKVTGPQIGHIKYKRSWSHL